MTTLTQSLIALALILLLGLLADPFMLWMPTNLEMLLALLAALLLAAYAGFVLKEQGGDERDLLHRMLAGRAAYLATLGVLTLALLYQGLTHSIDPWIPAALALAILAKLATHLWAGRYR